MAYDDCEVKNKNIFYENYKDGIFRIKYNCSSIEIIVHPNNYYFCVVNSYLYVETYCNFVYSYIKFINCPKTILYCKQFFEQINMELNKYVLKFKYENCIIQNTKFNNYIYYHNLRLRYNDNMISKFKQIMGEKDFNDLIYIGN